MPYPYPDEGQRKLLALRDAERRIDEFNADIIAIVKERRARWPDVQREVTTPMCRCAIGQIKWGTALGPRGTFRMSTGAEFCDLAVWGEYAGYLLCTRHEEMTRPEKKT